MQNLFTPADYFKKITVSELQSAFITSPKKQSKPLNLELDIGCGEGDFLIEMAQAYPQRNFLGLEKFFKRVKKICRKAEAVSTNSTKNLANLKIMAVEARYALEYLLPENAFDRIHCLFPDPWPKRRHQKNQLIDENFPELIYRLLKANGDFFLKTDDENYFHKTLKNFMKAKNLFQETTWSKDDFFYPQTQFEKLWLSKGKKIYNARYLRQ